VKKYTLDRVQLLKLLDRTIDLFLEYQYKQGYEEPKAREETLRDMMGSVDRFQEPTKKPAAK
jgi:hypothetical protein